MQKIRLGRTGLMVTKTAMGCLPVQRCNDEAAIELLRAAYDGGINYFDTANAYSDSEKKIGLALSDVRDKIIISTKSLKSPTRTTRTAHTPPRWKRRSAAGYGTSASPPTGSTSPSSA